jgi:hypothetical protein
LVAQVFNLCKGFSHSLERLCHQAEKLMGNDEPGERGLYQVALIEVKQVLVGATRWVALFWENI